MLIKFEYLAGSDEWNAFCKAMFSAGHIAAIRYERVTPSDPSIVYPMGDCYISDRGEKCWPWVIFAAPLGSPHRGYVLEGVAPLPVGRAPSRQRVKRPPRVLCKSAKAARWFVAQNGAATRQEAADKYGISLPALSVALGTLGPVPRGRSDGRSARAARWTKEHPEFTRYDIARLFGISYGTLCNALRRNGIDKPPSTRNNLTNEEIEALRRRLAL